MTRECTQCGKEFTLTHSELEFYKNKDLEIPKRCKACREKNKKGMNSHQASNAGKKKWLTDSFRKHPVLTTLALIFLSVFGVFFSTTDSVPDHGISSVGQSQQVTTYDFRSEKYLNEHFEKHKDEFNFVNASEYLQGANDVISHKDVLHKLEAEDGDDVYYLEATNELVVISTDGYIRTYFKPSDGINYYNRK